LPQQQKNKAPKLSLPTSSPSGDKGEKSKSKKTDKHCKYFEKDGHVESKCFKKMEVLETTMKKHKINIDSSSSSHGHALAASSFSSNATSTFSFDERLIDSRASYHMAKDKAIFSALNECNIGIKYLLVMIDLLLLWGLEQLR
jgi:hypothetical protein